MTTLNLKFTIQPVETSRRDVSTLADSTPVGSTTDHLSNARQTSRNRHKNDRKMGYGRRKPEVEALRREIETLKI